MKAIKQDSYGSADVLEFRDVADPVVGENEVLVRVKAAGLDAGVWHLMTGRPYFMRLLGFGFLRPKKNPIPGREVAGIVEKVGAEVTRFRPGDEVMGVCDGAFAEYVATPSNWLVSKPAQSLLRTGRGRRDLGGKRPPGAPRQGTGPAKAKGVDHRGRGRRRFVRGADRQGLRCRGNRCVQHEQGGPGPLDRRGSRDRLHPH